MFIKYPSINQYRNSITWVKGYCKHHEIPLPTTAFIGTVKLHGTNAGIIRRVSGGPVSFCSREREISVESDNAGFAQWGTVHLDHVNKMFDAVAAFVKNHYKPADNIQIVGEWCGGNIQSGVGLVHLPKMFVVFGIRVVPEEFDGDGLSMWFTAEAIDKVLNDVVDPEHQTYHIYQFPTWVVDIDFNNPEAVQNEFVRLTKEVEDRCPVAAQLLGDAAEGKELIGEGIVWTPYGGLGQALVNVGQMPFKTKGEKHSASKVKTLAAVDVEKLNSIEAFVDYACTENRLAQGIDKFREMGLEMAIENVGQYIRWVNTDIAKEELDTLQASGLTMKDVGSKISNRARAYFIAALDKTIGL
jgi:hypothetical protein